MLPETGLHPKKFRIWDVANVLANIPLLHIPNISIHMIHIIIPPARNSITHFMLQTPVILWKFAMACFVSGQFAWSLAVGTIQIIDSAEVMVHICGSSIFYPAI